MVGPELPVIYENPRFDKATPTLQPVINRAIGFGAVMMMEWGTLTLIEDSPRYLKFATIVVAGLILAVHESWPWLRMRDWRWYPALMVTFVAGYFAIFGYSLYTEPGHKSSSDEIAAAVVKILPKPTWDAGIGTAGVGQMPIGGPPAESLLEQPNLIWDGKDGQITFQARVDHSGEKLPVYLDWGQAGFFGQQTFNNGFYQGPRVEIGFVERFVVGQLFKVTIGTVSTDPSGQQMLQWGEPHYNNAKVGISQGAYVARVVIIGKDGKEERYPFLIIPAPHAPGSPAPWAPPSLVGTGVLQGAIQ